jgi:hypothetical protein
VIKKNKDPTWNEQFSYRLASVDGKKLTCEVNTLQKSQEMVFFFLSASGNLGIYLQHVYFVTIMKHATQAGVARILVYKYMSDWPLFLKSQIWDWNAVFKHELIGEIQVKLDEVQLNRTGASAEIW